MSGSVPTEKDFTVQVDSTLPARTRAALRPAVREYVRVAGFNQMPQCFTTTTLRIFSVVDRTAEVLGPNADGCELAIHAQAVTGDALVLPEAVVFSFEYWERPWTSGAILTSVDVVRGSQRVPIADVMYERHLPFMPHEEGAQLLAPGRHLARAFGRGRPR